MFFYAARMAAYVRPAHQLHEGQPAETEGSGRPRYAGSAPPPAVSNPSDNLKNLFEIPVIFYALALYLFVTNQVDPAYVAAAWVFVLFRALHSAIHCTVNIVMLRFYLYLFSTLAVWFIAARAAFLYLAP